MEESLIQGKRIDEWTEYIINALTTKYKSVNIKDELWFYGPDKAFVFHVNVFENPLCGYIIEYVDNVNELYAAEDGEQYSILDYNSPEDMLKVMIEEIEQ